MTPNDHPSAAGLWAVTLQRGRENFYGFCRNLQRRWLLRPWDELDDPLSSFVPDFRTPPSAGFFLACKEHRLPVLSSEAASEPLAPGQPESSRMARVEGGRSLQSVVFGHQVRRRPARLAAPTQPLLGDVILARPVFLARLTYSCLLANALSHRLVLWDRQTAPPCYLAHATAHSARDGKRRFRPQPLVRRDSTPR
jgi:hypothetical protein